MSRVQNPCSQSAPIRRSLIALASLQQASPCFLATLLLASSAPNLIRTALQDDNRSGPGTKLGALPTDLVRRHLRNPMLRGQWEERLSLLTLGHNYLVPL
eukprot:5319837-Amphidinium_carterae.1